MTKLGQNLNYKQKNWCTKAFRDVTLSAVKLVHLSQIANFSNKGTQQSILIHKLVKCAPFNFLYSQKNWLTFVYCSRSLVKYWKRECWGRRKSNW